MYLPRMAVHTATGEASRVYSISLNKMTDGCFLRGRGASCIVSNQRILVTKPNYGLCTETGPWAAYGVGHRD